MYTQIFTKKIRLIDIYMILTRYMKVVCITNYSSLLADVHFTDVNFKAKCVQKGCLQCISELMHTHPRFSCIGNF